MSSLPNVARAKKSRLTGLPPSLTDRGTWLPVAVFLTLVLIFSLTSPAFFSWRNLAATTGEAATLLIASLGASFVILMGSIDLSVGATVLLVATATVAGLKHIPDTNPGLLVLPFGALLGGSLGAFNGAITVLGKIPSFVVTLGSLSVFTGIALSILAGATIMFDLPIFEMLSLRQSIPHLPNIALCALLLWLIFIFIGARTRFGRFALLIGGGEQVARTAGIPVDRYKIYAFIVSGVTAGLAAIFAVSGSAQSGPASAATCSSTLSPRSSSAVPRSPAASAASTARSSASRSSS